VQEKLVRGDNISQAAQFVESGSADIGFVALSVAMSPSMKPSGRFVEIPATAYPTIRQAVVIVKASKKQELARRFVEYFKNPQSSETLRQYGFTLPSTMKK
jgi:molybdate transport system substrate-binding protein